MPRRLIFIAVIMVLCLSPAGLSAAVRIDLKLRVYEGSREGALAPPDFVASSYLQSTVQARLRIESDLEKERAEIRRVFNLQDIRLLTEADLIIGEGGQAPDRVRHSFRLNGSAFMVHVVTDLKDFGRYVVAFNEMTAEKPTNVLTTEMNLVGSHSAVFGFENKQGKPYFCSFRITGPAEIVPPPPPSPPPPPPIPEETRKAIAELEKGAVKITNEAMPPRLLKMVDPEYPTSAPITRRDGSAYLSVRIDGGGNVVRAVVITSSDKVFEEPAIRTVKQWKYEPYLKDGKAVDAVFSVILRFRAK